MIVRLLNVVVPVSVWVLLLPSKITVPVPPVNVPVLAQLPKTVMLAAVPATKVPAVSVRLPFISMAVVPPAPVSVFVLLMTTLLKVLVASVPSMFPAEAPSKVIVVGGVKVKPVVCVKLAPMLRVAGEVNVPAVNTRLPSRSSAVVLPPVLKVWPGLLTVIVKKV